MLKALLSPATPLYIATLLLLTATVVLGQTAPTLSADRTAVKTGDPLTIAASGFIAGQNLQLWAIPYRGERSCTRPPASYTAENHPLYEMTANADGDLDPTAITIDASRYQPIGTWMFCILGTGEAELVSPRLNVNIHDQYRLVGWHGGKYLTPGERKIIQITPWPPQMQRGDIVTLLINNRRATELTVTFSGSVPYIDYTVPDDLYAGNYELAAVIAGYQDRPEIRIGATFVVSPTIEIHLPEDEDPPSPFAASQYEVGQTLAITGRYYTPDLAVTVSAYHDSSCPDATEAAATIDTLADAEGRINARFYLDPESFQQAGRWVFCATDGEGHSTVTGTDIQLMHTLVLNEDISNDQLNAGETNTITFHPPLPVGADYVSATLRGQTLTEVGVIDSTDGRVEKLTLPPQSHTSDHPINLSITIRFPDGTERTLVKNVRIPEPPEVIPTPTPTPTPEPVTEYQLIIPNDGRVVAGESVRIMVQVTGPPPEEDLTVTGLRAAGKEQPCTPESDENTNCLVDNRNVFTWLEVDVPPGTVTTLTASVNGASVSAPVVVLYLVPDNRSDLSLDTQCPGLTELENSTAPGTETRITFRFSIRPDQDEIACPVPAPPPDYRPIRPPDATTILPTEGVVIKLHPDYQLPRDARALINVSSYANRHGYEFRTDYIHIKEAEASNRHDTIEIPGCASWENPQGDPAACQITHARSISFTLEGDFTTPADASRSYVTEAQYRNGLIWDIATLQPDISIDPIRLAFGEDVTIEGNGFPARATTRIFGINTDQNPAPQGEGSDTWNCDQIVAHGVEIATGENDAADRFEIPITIGRTNFRVPGNWLLCVQSGGLTNQGPHALTIDYQAEPQKQGDYPPGETTHIRIVPTPPEGEHAQTLRIGGQDVEFETEGDAIYFVMPPNSNGKTPIHVTFPHGIEATITVETSSPPLSVEVIESDRRARPGSLVRLSAKEFSGETVCNPTLDNVTIALWQERRIPEDNCVGIGANRELYTQAIIADPDGEISRPLADVFNAGQNATIELTSSNGAVLSAEISLAAPQLSFRLNGEAIPNNRLIQYRPITVHGANFPEQADHYDAPTVGYKVRGGDDGNQQSATADGTWSALYRITSRTENNDRIEFLPTINGHPLPAHSAILNISVPNPGLSIEPSTVYTGAIVTITGRHLDKFREGYQIVIVDGDHIIKLADPDGEAKIYDTVPSENETGDEDEAGNRPKAKPLRPQRTKAGRAIYARSGRDGTFSVTTRFPEYEANRYRNGTAELELQIYNSQDEPIPGATTRVTHTYGRPAPTPTPVYVPTPTPPPVFAPTPTAVPTPTPAPTLGPTAIPTPTPPPSESTAPEDQERAAAISPPFPIDHNRVQATPAADGRSVELVWPRPVGPNAPDNYLIERAESPNAEPRSITELDHGDEPFYHDYETLPNREYFYYITAYNAAGAAPPDSTAPVYVRTPAPPGPVPNFSIAEEPGLSIVTLSWDAPSLAAGQTSPVDGFAIEQRADDTDDWTAGGAPDGYMRRWTLVNLRPGVGYEFRIAASNPVGPGPWSEPVNATMAGVRGGQPAAVPEPPEPTAEAAVTETGDSTPTPATDVPSNRGRNSMLIALGIIGLMGALYALYVFYSRYRQRLAGPQPLADTGDGGSEPPPGANPWDTIGRRPPAAPSGPPAPPQQQQPPPRPEPEPTTDTEAEAGIARMMAELERLRPEREPPDTRRE